ncbi:MAG: invasin domain 3-containing protein, partial [Halobacteriales archaeon]|nr:invasin domain 3-containing protein [Halobacteriales archaeon]
MRRIFLCLVGLALLVSAGCDDGTPVAPTGTVLTATANPTEISANGSSTITVSATRPNGTPVNPGTEIRLTTSLGSVDEFIETDARGLAGGTLAAGTRTGTATVTATSGGAEPASVDVEIGFRPGGITLLATPSAVTENGSTVSLLAVVRDEQGEPLENAAVTFRSEIGTLDSQGGIVRTDPSGEATDTLTVTEADANFTTAD